MIPLLLQILMEREPPFLLKDKRRLTLVNSTLYITAAMTNPRQTKRRLRSGLKLAVLFMESPCQNLVEVMVQVFNVNKVFCWRILSFLSRQTAMRKQSFFCWRILRFLSRPTTMRNFYIYIFTYCKSVDFGITKSLRYQTILTYARVYEFTTRHSWPHRKQSDKLCSKLH